VAKHGSRGVRKGRRPTASRLLASERPTLKVHVSSAPAQGAQVIDVFGPLADELRDLVDVFLDIMVADMAAHYALGPELSATSMIFARRAYLEAAVVAYGRVFQGGKRASGRPPRIQDLVDGLAPELRTCHDRILDLRGTHVGHRVSYRPATVQLSYTVAGPHVAVADVHASSTIEIDDPELMTSFGRLATTLRGMVGAQMDQLRFAILDLAMEDSEGLLAAIKRHASWIPRVDP
jgi:hypothetical protein